MAIFTAYELMGAALMWAAYLLPRRHGAEIPTLLVVAGILTCCAGLGYGLSVAPKTRAASFHHWTGRVTPPTSPAQVVAWAVMDEARAQDGNRTDGGGGGH